VLVAGLPRTVRRWSSNGGVCDLRCVDLADCRFPRVPALSYRSRQAGTQLFAGMDRQTGRSSEPITPPIATLPLSPPPTPISRRSVIPFLTAAFRETQRAEAAGGQVPLLDRADEFLRRPRRRVWFGRPRGPSANPTSIRRRCNLREAGLVAALLLRPPRARPQPHVFAAHERARHRSSGAHLDDHFLHRLRTVDETETAVQAVRADACQRHGSRGSDAGRRYDHRSRIHQVTLPRRAAPKPVLVPPSRLRRLTDRSPETRLGGGNTASPLRLNQGTSRAWFPALASD
jgi:hypothetical protein